VELDLGSLSAFTSSPRYVPMIASANPIGMLTMPTFWSGNAGWALAGSVQPGPMATSQIVTTVPPTSEATAPQVLNRFQKRVKRIAGRFAAEAITNATPATSAAALAVAPTRAASQIERSPTSRP